MSKRKEDDTRQHISEVMVYQSHELKKIRFPNMTDIETNIRESEELLLELGYEPGQTSNVMPILEKRVLTVPSWEELCKEAISSVGNHCELESIFTKEELMDNSAAICMLRDEFNQLHRLDNIDITISAIAGIVGAAVDILMVGIPKKTPDGLTAGKLSNFIRAYYEKRFPEEEMEKLANSKASKVPFDAQDNRNTVEYVEGLSAYYHRLLSLGHDPLLGFIVGVFDILTGRMTTIDKRGRFVSQDMSIYSDRKESNIFAALAKQFIHLKSDITTSMGLPAPLMGLFNLFQFGSIGEEDLTIAEIVQGMYFEGYDFIHFCSLSVPAMLVEVIVRLAYALKRIKEGKTIKESIPFSMDRKSHPKLATMLFIGHSGATAINAGKICFTKNPMAINYAQWLAFAKYSYLQVKWILIHKPELRDKYVADHLYEELKETVSEIDQLFYEYTKEYIVVFDS